MPAQKNTPLTRITAFGLVLGAFLIFGLLSLFLGLFSKTTEVNAADEAGAERRLQIKEEVMMEQTKNLSFIDNGATAQAPPSDIFKSFGAKLAASKPSAVKEDRHRDPNLSDSSAQ